MRNQLLKLRKGKSTKAERIFAEILKSHRIQFRAKVKIDGQEIDFIVGKYAIEINGHAQSSQKNDLLLRAGYIPLNIINKHVLGSEVLSIIKILTK